MTTPEMMKSRLIEFRSRLYGKHDLSAVDDFVHPEFRSHNGLLKPGLDAYKAFARSFHEGLPDMRPDMYQILVEGDRIVAFTNWQGTHSGPFRGMAPTGRNVSFETADLYRLQDGLLIEHWDIVDRLAASIGLGLVSEMVTNRPVGPDAR